MDELGTEQLKDYINQFYKLGTRVFFLQGGEPLIRKDAVEIAKHIKSMNCYCSITTNGTVHSRIPEIAPYVNHIELSIDGPPEVNSITRGEGVYEKVVEAARIATSLGVRVIFHGILTRHNIAGDKWMHLLELAKEFDAGATVCFAKESGASNSTESAISVSDEEKKAYYKKIIELKRNGAPISNSYNALRHAADWPIALHEIGYKHNLPSKVAPCMHGKLAVWMDADGTLYPCPTSFNREGFGFKIDEKGVKDAWQRMGALDCHACGGVSEVDHVLGLRLENIMKAAKGF
jgi:MoaA/NifB/PqqE/SkfB family radical SAM enzyme